jgi:hypothetical protein
MLGSFYGDVILNIETIAFFFPLPFPSVSHSIYIYIYIYICIYIYIYILPIPHPTPQYITPSPLQRLGAPQRFFLLGGGGGKVVLLDTIDMHYVVLVSNLGNLASNQYLTNFAYFQMKTSC